MDDHHPDNLYRLIPKVDRVLEHPALASLLGEHPRPLVLDELRELLEDLRSRAAEGTLTAVAAEPEVLAGRLEERLEDRRRPYYRRVINGTGVILHTGLGRAPLAAPAVEALTETAGRSQRLEVMLETGLRGGRDRGCARLLEELLGCEAATVVNNNAAATLVILAALARGRRVVLSRGEMVEIGGSYRVPEILEESGAVLHEVGTTNRTHERDYLRALETVGPDGAETEPPVGLLLKVHTSNYRVVGFTKEVPLEALVEMGRAHGVPVVHDLGSGCLVDLASRGRPGETRVRESLEAGADLVCFSGDKLLGGPQAGVIAGRRELVDRCRRHPLFRALRPGRLVYAALEATLKVYQRGEEAAFEQIPALNRLVASPEELRRRAEALLELVRGLEVLSPRLVESASQAGSGSLPARDYASWALRVEVPGLEVPEATGGGDLSLEELARRLRTGEPAILGRIQDGGLLLDVRTLTDDELPWIAVRLREVLR